MITKKQYNNLKIDQDLTVTGRGLILVVDLKKNGLAEGDWTFDIIIKLGDEIFYKDNIYAVVAIECTGDLFSGKNKSVIGLVVKKVEPKK